MRSSLPRRLQRAPKEASLKSRPPRPDSRGKILSLLCILGGRINEGALFEFREGKAPRGNHLTLVHALTGGGLLQDGGCAVGGDGVIPARFPVELVY